MRETNHHSIKREQASYRARYQARKLRDWTETGLDEAIAVLDRPAYRTPPLTAEQARTWLDRGEEWFLSRPGKLMAFCDLKTLTTVGFTHAMVTLRDGTRVRVDLNDMTVA